MPKRLEITSTSGIIFKLSSDIQLVKGVSEGHTYIKDVHVQCIEHSASNPFITTFGEVYAALQGEYHNEESVNISIRRVTDLIVPSAHMNTKSQVLRASARNEIDCSDVSFQKCFMVDS